MAVTEEEEGGKLCVRKLRVPRGQCFFFGRHVLPKPSIFCAHTNDSRGGQTMPHCTLCNTAGAELTCACHTAAYCSIGCQKADWDDHAAACEPKIAGPHNGRDHHVQDGGIVVTGHARLEVEPDVVIVDAGIEISAPAISDAWRQARVGMTLLMEVLQKHDVARKDIRTTQLVVLQHREYKDSKWVDSGFRVSNTMEITVRKTEHVADLIDALTQQLGNELRISSVRFEIDKPEQYEPELRRKAVEDALAKAKQIAAVAGENLGRLQRISEGQGDTAFQRARTFAASAAESQPISGGTQQLSLSVRATFSIEHAAY